MKKVLLFGLALSVGLTVSLSSVSQTVKIDGELRTRSELRDGFKAPLADSLAGTLVTAARTRLNISYSGDKVDARITLQDTHYYGSTATSSTGSTLGIFEAWASYAFTKNFLMSIGRQAIEYDDKRMLSASNWSNTGNAHDLALFKFEKNDLKFHLGTAYNNTGDDLTQTTYSVTQSYKSMVFAWLGKSLGKVNASALWVNNGFQRGTTADLLGKLFIRNTVGANFDFKNKAFPATFYASAYYQFGHDASGNSLKAYLLAFKSKLTVAKTVALTLGVDYMSGSKYDISSGKSKTFNKLYGANHLFNGSMEYWSTLPSRGLADIYGGITYSPNKKFNIDATFHSFSLAQRYASTNSKKGLGSELDIAANYLVSPIFNIQGGWSSYFTTDLTKTIKKVTGDATAKWAYIMLSFKPKFL